MIRYIFMLCLALLLSGCMEQPKPTTIYIPELNKTSTVEVGQNMYEKVHAIYECRKSVKFSEEVASKYNNRDNCFKKLKNNECDMFIRLSGGKFYKNLIDKNCDGKFTNRVKRQLFDKTVLEKPIKYQIVNAKPSKIVNDSFKYVVLYQGKVGNKLNISFQSFVSIHGEFIIRDAFTQNIQYELDKNGEALIGFKGLRIKVLKATNLDITYKVISDYD